MSEMKKSKRASSSDLLSNVPNPGSNTPNVTLGMQKQSFFQRFSIRQLFCSQFVPSHRRGKNKSSKISKRKDSPFMETRSESGGSETSTQSRSNSVIQSDKGHTSRDSSLLECPLCMETLPRECFPALITCHHLSCSSCLQQYFKIEITEARVNITCPQCAECMHPTDLYAIVNDLKIMLKYEEFMLRRILAIDPDTRWCPAPDCSYAVIASGCAGCPKLKCERPGCSTYFCYHCKAEWHPNQTCDTARALRSPYSQETNMNYSLDSVSKDQIKPCPRCSVLIVKMDDGSCNHMTCAVCSAEFCWLCMKEISDLHYLSPSGCTFWGKKPWSRKKKIMWQLGTLVGAPVGIALVAGISVPAMIIGIPVWVGRKVYSHYQNSNKHKRNLAMTGGVTASILISPVLAALAVGIGVPILLFYVYGVVPIFLCRSGGCGVITSASGVRIDFDEDSDDTNFKSDAHLLEIMGGRGNYPRRSRAGSVSLDDSSQLDPPELSCNQALTGASRCPSVSSNLAGAHSHRMDSVSNQRYSLSNDSASGTVSLSDKSANIQLDGISNVSNVALAGSLLNYKFNNEGTTPVEVHVDSNLDKTEFQHLPSVSPVSSFSGEDLLSSFRRSGRKRMVIDRQASENGSLWSQDDTYSERVRFDDNVSFIDEESASQGAQAENSSYHGARPKWNKHMTLQCDNHPTTLEDCDERESRNSSSSVPVESKCNLKSSQSWTNLDHRITNTLNSKSVSCIITS